MGSCLMGTMHGGMWCSRCSGTFLSQPALTFSSSAFLLDWLFYEIVPDGLAFGACVSLRCARSCHQFTGV